ncbi:endonuclease V [Thermogladius sp.]|uniref:endonuclease V n=1 Tax=Thermogladius sp. TaxID=2023064 RepID=UPI003D0F7412
MVELFDYSRATRLQRELFKQVIASVERPLFREDEARLVAGLDASYTRGLSVGVAVLMDLHEMRVVDKKYAVVRAGIPYVPGLLAFREAPGVIRALLELEKKPDVLMVDGHGLTHPRGFGIASHVGLVTGIPSVGVAKSRLYGEEKVEGGVRYVYAHGVKAGVVVEHGGSELYVSIGYSVTLEQAVRLVKKTLLGHKLPEPLYQADLYSREVKRLLDRKTP